MLEHEDASSYVGRLIAGRFRIDQLIDEGGMGVVCRATQLGLNRTVAIKLLSPRLNPHREDLARRFHLEAATLARLRHPNLVTIYDYGRTETGELYFVMEYLHGRPLSQVIDQDGPLSWDRLLQMAIQVCRGLREAHAHGVVHRDLKPSNIMVIAGDEETAEVAKILDFGLVKWLNGGALGGEDERAAEEKLAASADGLQGSPRFMSPEQITGEAVDLRSDLYSFGAVVFAMVTGVPPFDGSNAVEIMQQHLATPAPRPSTVGYPRQCSPVLEELLLRCLEKDPARRYANANEVLTHLKGVLQRVCGLEVRPAGGELPSFVPPGIPQRRWASLPPTDPGLGKLIALNAAPPEAAITVSATRPVHALPPLPDLNGAKEVFGDYTLLGVLAQGGMGRLYVAERNRDGAPFGVVALKRVLPHLADDPSFRSMFAAEARFAAGLKHPNIVVTHEVGEVNGQPYISMEYLPGEDLQTVLGELATNGRGPVPAEVAAIIAAECARGLHHAHETPDASGRPTEVVHRDVNPSNVFVTYDGRVKLLDFGVAKIRTRESTRAGTFKGKLSYSSPEQLMGAQVDRRADIFCLGIALWECLTGLQLFAGESEASKVEAIRTKQIPPPSSSWPQVPRQLDQIVLHALARAPDSRFSTAKEMADALEHFLATRPGHRAREDVLRTWLQQVMPRERVAAKLALATRPSTSRPPSPPPRNLPEQEPTPSSTQITADLARRVESTVHPLATDPAHHGPRGRGAPLVMGVALLCLGAGLVWYLGRESAPAPAPLKAPVTASVEVVSDPPGALILVNGEPTGQTTPGTLTRLAPGVPLSISVMLSGMSPETKEVRPTAGSEQRVELSLRPAIGALRLVGAPRAARIYIDDRPVGASERLDLAIGPHQLRVELGDRLLLTRTVKVSPGENTIDLGAPGRQD